MTNITWHSGFNDPDLLGIITFALYLVVAVLCWRNHRAQKQSLKNPHSTAWAWLSAGFSFFGLNKQLDLQTLLIQSGRELALATGFYQDRFIFHQLFFGFFAFATILAFICYFHRFKPFLLANRFLTSLLILLIIVLIARSASIDHMIPRAHEEAFSTLAHWFETGILSALTVRTIYTSL